MCLMYHVRLKQTIDTPLMTVSYNDNVAKGGIRAHAPSHDEEVLILLLVGVGVIGLDLGLLRPRIADHGAVGRDMVDTALAGDRHILSPVARIGHRDP